MEALIIISSFIVLLIGFFIYLGFRDKKFNKFVLDNSEALHRIKQLNDNTVFDYSNNVFSFSQEFDNKSYWYKTSPVDVLSRQIRNNLDYWLEIQKRVKDNQYLFEHYKNNILNLNYLSPDFCREHGMNFKKVSKIEHDLVLKEKQHPPVDIRVTVTLRYTSAKGNVRLTKFDTFFLTQVSRIIDSVSPSRVDRKTYERLALAERSILTNSMRYDVLRRDGFRCVLCGMSSKDGAILHVDHIIPVSKGGKTTMDNLRTLCERCNLGKSNKIE